MKAKIILLLFLGMLNLQAQTAKKPTPATKPTTKAAPTTKTITNSTSPDDGIFATITTNKGDITLKLEYKKTPVTVANFISLAEGNNTFVTDTKFKGKPFYDGLKFHRVIADFMIQGGDPTGTGSGSPGYSFKDEITDLKFNKGGLLAMANSGPATNGSQFFITHKDTPWLDGKHTIFGSVITGMDVVNKIAQDDVILKVTINRKGAEAKAFDAPKVFSTYFLNKDEDAKIEAAKKTKAEADAKTAYTKKYAPVIKLKTAEIAHTKKTGTKTASGLIYKITKKGTGVKPANGTQVNIRYAGYFEDGTLFDSNFEAVAKAYGKYDANRATQGGYAPFAFEAGKKDGMIPGFIEGLSLMSFGDKAMVILPPNLAYGANGAGGVIPPNATLIFEIEMTEIK